jgi:hypothetical protein
VSWYNPAIKMDRDSAFSQTCYCGRSFTNLAAFSNHQRTCKKSKKRLTDALRQAKESIADRNRPRDVSGSRSSVGLSNDLLAQAESSNVTSPNMAEHGHTDDLDEVSEMCLL